MLTTTPTNFAGSLVTRGLASLYRRLKVIGVALVIAALALTGAQFTAMSASAAGNSTPALASGTGSISGTVTNAADAPIVGAEVTARWYNAESDSWEASESVTTTAQGTYQVLGLPDGDYKIQFLRGSSSTSYVEQWYDNASNSDDAATVTISNGEAVSGIDADLAVGYAVTGRVTNALHANLSGISVTAYLYDSGTEEFSPVSWADTKGSGMYEFPALLPGTYTFSFTSQSDAAVKYQSRYYGGARSVDDATPVVISGSDRTGIDIELIATNSISGVVKNTSVGSAPASALEGIIVRALDDNLMLATTTTDSRGAYTLSGLDDGTYVLEFSSHDLPAVQYATEYFDNQTDRYTALDKFPIIASGGKAYPNKNANLVLAGTITGTISPADSTNDAVISNQDAMVLACSFTAYGWDSGWGCNAGRSFIGENGSYTLYDLAPGSYRVYVEYYGSQNLLSEYYSTTSSTAWNDRDASTVTVTAGGTTPGKNIDLNTGATISGTVTKTGAGVETSVTVWQKQGVWLQNVATAQSDSSGNYTVDKLLPGAYTVSADGSNLDPQAATQWNGGGYSEHRAPKITLAVSNASASTATANFALETAASVSGVVKDAAGGAGLPDVSVTATRWDSANSQSKNEQTDFSVSTEADGSYTLTGLQPGTYTLDYYKDGYQDAQSNTRFVLDSGQATTQSDVTMRSRGAITGRVTDASGTPLAGVVVNDSPWCERCGNLRTKTDVSGNYTLTGLDPLYAQTVYFHTESLDKASKPITYADSTLTVPLGTLTDSGPVTVNTAVMNISSIVTGKVTDSAGAPQANMQIDAVVKVPWGEKKFTVSSTSSALDGSYTLTDVPQGAILHFSTNPLTSATVAKFASQYDGGTTDIDVASGLSFTKPGQTLRHDMVLLPIGSITGTIKKGATALAGVRVSAIRTDPNNPYLFLGYGEAVTNSSGVYTIPGLAQGSYSVSFNNRASGANMIDASGALVDNVSTSVAHSETTTLVPWNAAATANAILAPTFRVSGTVTGPSNAKLAGVQVLAYPWSGTAPGTELTQGEGFDSTTTNSDGNYTLVLTAGDYVIKFVDPLGRVSTRYLGGTTVPSGTNKVRVATTALTGKNITLAATGATLTGSVVTQNGDAPSGGGYTLERMADDGTTVLSDLLPPYWNSIGDAFPIKNLEPGKYRLVMSDGVGSKSELTITFTVVGSDVTTYTVSGYAYPTPVTGSNGNLGEITIFETGWWDWPEIDQNALPVLGVIGGSEVPTVGSWLQSNNSLQSWKYLSVDWPGDINYFDYQWLRNGREIANATSAQYQVAPGDAGAAISLRITAEGMASYTTVATELVAPGSLGEGTAPVITAAFGANNSISVGQTATVTPGTYSTQGLNYAYQWSRGGTPISGATSATYVITSADVGLSITATVETRRPGYVTDVRTTAPLENVVPSAAPKRTAAAAPTKVGTVYTAKPGTWTPAAGVTFRYSWIVSDGIQTTNTTEGPTLNIQSDLTSRIVLRTKASKAGLADTTIDDVVRVGTGLAISETPSVSGSGAVGSPLTVSATSNHSTATYAYQWYRGTDKITGAVAARYEPAAADVGKSVSVKVTAKDAGFANSVERASAGTTVTAATVGNMSEGVAVAGNYWVGRTLSASTGTWAPTPTSFSYKWMRAASNGGAYAAIAGATASKYTLVAADLGKFVKVVVTPVRTGSTYNPFSSAANESAVQTSEIANVVAPSIGAVANVGTALTATAGTWDVAGARFSYQWYLNNRVIPGATAATYTPKPEDVFDEITVRVISNKSGYPTGTEAAASKSVTVMPGKAIVLAASAAPTFKVDTSTANATASSVLSWGNHTLKGTSGTWPAGARSVDYQWQYLAGSDASWTPIVGENTATLVMVTSNDEVMRAGWKYRLLVTVRRAGYQDSTSSSVEVLLQTPPA